MIGFQASLEKCFYYFLMFLASISFYTIFGQFMVYTTPSQQTAQVPPCHYTQAPQLLRHGCCDFAQFARCEVLQWSPSKVGRGIMS
jgi:hypothetical protein